MTTLPHLMYKYASVIKKPYPIGTPGISDDPVIPSGSFIMAITHNRNIMFYFDISSSIVINASGVVGHKIIGHSYKKNLEF